MVNLRKQINMTQHNLPPRKDSNLHHMQREARRAMKAKQVGVGLYEHNRDKLVGICGIEGCAFYGGYLDLPLCEEHAWHAFEVLKNNKSKSETRERVRQQWIECEEADKEEEHLRQLEREERWKTKTTIEAGFIYYLLVGDLIKIGYTRSLEDRLKAYPPNAKLLATHPGTLKVEKQMHHKFLHHLAKGREWFDQGADLMEHIAKTKQDFKQHQSVAA